MLKACILPATLQLGSVGLLSPLFASNPEPPPPLQLDLSLAGEAAWQGCPGRIPTTASPREHAPAAVLLPTTKGLLSCLAGCSEAPEAETQLIR